MTDSGKIEVHMPDGMVVSIPIQSIPAGNPKFYAGAVRARIDHAHREILRAIIGRYGVEEG